MRQEWRRAIERAIGSAPTSARPMGGGSVGDVFLVTLADGRAVVAKVGDGGDGDEGDGGGGLALEGFMLGYLRDKGALPVPDVLYAAADVLVMSLIETAGGITDGVEREAADILARLHDVSAAAFGFERATVIGGLHQPNPWTQSWIDFFREQRLLYMGRQALAAGRLPTALMGRIETLAGRLERWLAGDSRPALIHGDMWTGNVLSRRGRVAGFVDPAIYYADAEVELAFATLFGTFGDIFFARYREHRPLRPGFFEERRDLYNLYPLLVHVRLFGGHYVAAVERTLKRFGC